MQLGFSHPRSTGIEVTSSKIKVVSIRKNRNEYEIIHLKEYSLPLSENDSKTIEKLSKTGPLISAVDARHLLVRSLDLRLQAKKDIESALPFQIEPHLPYGIENALLSYQEIEQHSHGSLLSVFCVRKDHLAEQIEKLRSLTIEAEKITSTPLAIATLSPFLTSEKKPLLILHLGEEKSFALVTNQGKLLASHPIHVGLKDKESESFEKEISKIICAIELNHKSDFVLLISESCDFIEKIQKITGKPLVLPALIPFRLSTAELNNYAIPLGMALSSFSDTSIDFRQKEFKYPYRWKRLKSTLYTYFSLCLVLYCLVYFIGKTSLLNKEIKMKEEIKELLSFYPEIEYSPQLETTLYKLDSHIEEKLSAFPLLPRVPNFSELVALLSLFDKEGKSLKIESIRFFMEHFPTIQNKKEHYQVKVELEITASLPSHAKAFYDFLLQQKSFIDLQKEVKWQNEKGKYRATLYLQDKTSYV